jgi:lipopolysaccharide assembly outer membrane protein LptD (OstA)
MKKLVLTLSTVTVACLLWNAYVFAQLPNPQPSAISIEADSIERLIPVQEIGVIKDGPANIPLTASGNVVVVIEGIRITANSAVWHQRENRIELNGGSVQLELPRQPTSFRLLQRP